MLFDMFPQHGEFGELKCAVFAGVDPHHLLFFTMLSQMTLQLALPMITFEKLVSSITTAKKLVSKVTS